MWLMFLIKTTSSETARKEVANSCRFHISTRSVCCSKNARACWHNSLSIPWYKTMGSIEKHTGHKHYNRKNCHMEVVLITNLGTFKSSKNNVKIGWVNAQRNLRHIRFRRKEIDETWHHCFSVQHPFIHVDIKNLHKKVKYAFDTIWHWDVAKLKEKVVVFKRKHMFNNGIAEVSPKLLENQFKISCCLKIDSHLSHTLSLIHNDWRVYLCTHFNLLLSNVQSLFKLSFLYQSSKPSRTSYVATLPDVNKVSTLAYGHWFQPA